MKSELINLRNKIDDIDANIVRLIGERLEIVRKIGEVKRIEDLSIQDPEREAKLYIKLNTLAQEYQVPLDMLVHIYEYIMNISRREQE